MSFVLEKDSNPSELHICKVQSCGYWARGWFSGEEAWKELVFRRERLISDHGSSHKYIYEKNICVKSTQWAKKLSGRRGLGIYLLVTFIRTHRMDKGEPV